MNPSFSITMDETTFGRCRLIVDGSEHEIDFSDTTDAVGDLLRAMTTVVSGGACASCRFDREPGAWIWRFDRRKVGEVQISVRDAASDQLRFQAAVGMDAIGRALLGEVDRLSLNTEDYEGVFAQPFPKRAVAALRGALETG
jgi:hypothetical protein